MCTREEVVDGSKKGRPKRQKSKFLRPFFYYMGGKAVPSGFIICGFVNIFKIEYVWIHFSFFAFSVSFGLTNSLGQRLHFKMCTNALC